MAKHAIGSCNRVAPQEDMGVWEMTSLPVIQTTIEEVLPRLFPVLKPLRSCQQQECGSPLLLEPGG